MAEEIRVTRDRLAEFISDHDTLKQFELLIDLVNSLNIDGSETLEEIITRIHLSLP